MGRPGAGLGTTKVPLLRLRALPSLRLGDRSRPLRREVDVRTQPQPPPDWLCHDVTHASAWGPRLVSRGRGGAKEESGAKAAAPGERSAPLPSPASGL